MRNPADNLILIEDPGLNRLFERLKKGMQIKSRIVFVLNENKYLLRIHGYNLVMESKLKFERKEEILIEIQSVRPKLKLRLLKKNDAGAQSGSTDLIV